MTYPEYVVLFHRPSDGCLEHQGAGSRSEAIAIAASHGSGPIYELIGIGRPGAPVFEDPAKSQAA